MYLTLLLLLPLLAAILIFLFAKTQALAKYIALGVSVATFIITLVLYAKFDPAAATYQFTESIDWIPSIGISYSVGIDGISLLLLLLTPFLFCLSIVFSWNKEHRYKEFYALIMLMQVGIIGVFISLDFFMFYLFWEVVLIPMYFLIGIWGGENKHYAAIKFFIYTHVASLFMLIGILAMYFEAGLGTFSMPAIAEVSPQFALAFQLPVFIALFFGFGVKMPMVPFHTWLPDAHVQAPTAGSVLLAGLLLKMGGYGMIRIAMLMLPQAMAELWWLVATFGVASMIYGAFLCLAQTDLKSLIAYSSISHMGFVLFGYAALTTIGVSGAIFQMFSHGLVSALLFMLAGAVKHGAHTRDIPTLRGLGKAMPVISVLLIFAFFASLGLPGLAGFVGEFMVFVGGYPSYGLLILIPLVTVVVTAAYYLWTLQKLIFTDFNKSLGDVKDAPMHEYLPMVTLVVFIIIFGLYPTPVMEIIHPVSEQITNFIRMMGGLA